MRTRYFKTPDYTFTWMIIMKYFNFPAHFVYFQLIWDKYIWNIFNSHSINLYWVTTLSRPCILKCFGTIQNINIALSCISYKHNYFKAKFAQCKIGVNLVTFKIWWFKKLIISLSLISQIIWRYISSIEMLNDLPKEERFSEYGVWSQILPILWP